MMKIAPIALFIAFLAQPAHAAGDDPVEISAAQSLEWNRTEKTYTARKDAIAKQGSMEVRSDTLTAFYSDAAGGTDIHKMTAEGNVVLTSAPYRGYSERAVYDLKTNSATLTGQNLKLETDTEYLTARDKIEFFGAENKLVATGDAAATRGTDTLKSDIITGFFGEDAQGKLVMQRMTAEGSVVITTAKETVTGDRGVYDVEKQQATITGRVKVLQGQNWLEGTRGEVDLRTGIAKIFAPENAGTEGRVKGVFYPKTSN